MVCVPMSNQQCCYILQAGQCGGSKAFDHAATDVDKNMMTHIAVLTGQQN